jgi:methionyl-tRNA formyltransferase
VVITRVLFMGTPDFAVPSLRTLLESPEIDVVAAITQPDRPAGRGLKLVESPVKRLALEKGIPLLQPDRIRGSLEASGFLDEHNPDLAVVAAFGQILPVGFFDAPKFGTINVHASLLPKYRGAAPVVFAILNGEKETGITIMQVEEGLDCGDMLAWRSLEIGPDTTASELDVQLAELGGELLIETIPLYVRGRARPVPQEEGEATYAPRIKTEQARIDWTRLASEVHDQIRAFNPRPGAFTGFRGKRLKIWTSGESQDPDGTVYAPGEIVGVMESRIQVACGEGSFLSISVLQPEGKRRMTAGDFANGVNLRSGEAFS